MPWEAERNQMAMSTELLCDTLETDEVIKGGNVNGRDAGLGLFAFVQLRVVCALIVPIQTVCCWSSYPNPDGEIK